MDVLAEVELRSLNGSPGRCPCPPHTAISLAREAAMGSRSPDSTPIAALEVYGFYDPFNKEDHLCVLFHKRIRTFLRPCTYDFSSTLLEAFWFSTIKEKKKKKEEKGLWNAFPWNLFKEYEIRFIPQLGTIYKQNILLILTFSSLTHTVEKPQ